MDKPRTEEEILNEVMEKLEDSQFAFVCFFDAFKRYLNKVKEKYDILPHHK